VRTSDAAGKNERTIRETDPARCIVINPDDRISYAISATPDHSAGCCGLDGCDGPNQPCANWGQTVGTARTDCWTEKEVRFWPEAAVSRTPQFAGMRRLPRAMNRQTDQSAEKTQPVITL
jgi:hypothetical protein